MAELISQGRTGRHSGVTLAATVGRLVTTEIINGVTAGELQELRPSRFT